MIAMSALCCCLAVAALMGRRHSGVQRLMPVTRRRSSIRLARPATVRLICATSGVVLAIVWGGAVGLCIGICLAVIGPVALGRLESRATHQRRDALLRQAPECADLLSACLASGAPLTVAAVATGEALGDPVSRPLRALADSLDLGADPVTAWRTVASEEPLAPLARAAARSAETGAPLSAVLAGIADDLRRDQHARADAAARAAGVKAVGPLAAAFLPAFLLIGVVPVVVSLALPFLASGVAS